LPERRVFRKFICEHQQEKRQRGAVARKPGESKREG